jgi:hypothetical protein
LPSTPIPHGRSRLFLVRTERAAGLTQATATAPFFVITLDCGTLTVARGPASFAPLAVPQLRAEWQAGQLRVEALGSGAASVQLQLLDLNGRLIADRVSAGGSVAVSLETSSEKPFAKGVYLAMITVKGKDGQILRRELKKLIVQR